MKTKDDEINKILDRAEEYRKQLNKSIYNSDIIYSVLDSNPYSELEKVLKVFFKKKKQNKLFFWRKESG